MQNLILHQIGFLDHPAIKKTVLSEMELLGFSWETAISVLLYNGGPKKFRKTFRNLSENCQLQKCFRKWSLICQNSARKLSDANICQNFIRKDLEMHQKCVRFYNYVRKLSVFYSENCFKSVRNFTFDTFLIHLLEL